MEWYGIAEEDFFRTVYIVSCGLEFESTRRAKQGNGQGATLQMNQMWFQNYLKKKAPHGDPQWVNVPLAQDTEESRSATNTPFETLEWVGKRERKGRSKESLLRILKFLFGVESNL